MTVSTSDVKTNLNLELMMTDHPVSNRHGNTKNIYMFVQL